MHTTFFKEKLSNTLRDFRDTFSRDNFCFYQSYQKNSTRVQFYKGFSREI